MHLRKILSRLTAGCLAAAVLSAPLAASANEYGGLCSKYGEPDITWKLTASPYNSGPMVFSGRGEIRSYKSVGVVPWYNFHSFIKSITIGSGITSIPERAFTMCERLEWVELGQSLKTIGDGAFRGSSLKEIRIPDNVTRIGENAFPEKCVLYAASTSTGAAYARENALHLVETDKPYLAGGDTDENEIIDTQDAYLTLDYFSQVSSGIVYDRTQGVPIAIGRIMWNGDVNQDGSVDTDDAYAMLCYYAYQGSGGEMVFSEWSQNADL